MSVLEFVADVVRSLAWPAVLVAAFFIFKTQFAGVIERLKSFSAPGVGAHFETRAAEAGDNAQAATPTVTADGEPTPVLEPVEVEQGLDPTYSVIAAWERVAAAVRLLALAADLPRNSLRSPVTIAAALRDLGFVNQNYVNAVQELGTLRNLVAHGKQRVSTNESLAFGDAANELIQATTAILALRFPTGLHDAEVPMPPPTAERFAAHERPAAHDSRQHGRAVRGPGRSSATPPQE